MAEERNAPTEPNETPFPVEQAGLEYQEVAALISGTEADAGVAPYAIDPQDLPAALEALVFASGEPIGLERLAEATGLEKDRILRTLRDLEEKSAADPRRGLMFREADGCWFLSTKPSVVEPLRRLFQPRNRPPLTQAAYETLAIIAYNQPATRAQIENVRGVGSDSIVVRLIERGLVREAGTLDAPGRPTLFETTEQFLQEFGLRSVHDLPSMEMMMYGTLREIEVQLEEAAGNRKDNQITIDQIAPGSLETNAGDAAATGPAPDPAEMLDLSEALFGSETEGA